MKAMLALEAIGYEAALNMRRGLIRGNDPRRWAAKTLARNGGKLPQPWVAELTASRDSHDFARVFVRHTKDFAQANGTGNRGVRFFFLLESGKVYEVQELTSWTNKRRFFCRVTAAGAIDILTEQETRAWLLEQTVSAASASASTKPQSDALAASLQTFLASMYRSPGEKTPQ